MRAFRQLNKVNKISAGGDHSLILDKGKVHAFGNNSYGQLGVQYPGVSSKPIMIQELPDIITISAGDQYSLMVDKKGEVYSVGNNFYGQLGLGQVYHTTIPTKIPNVKDIVQVSTSTWHSLLLDKDGKVYSIGSSDCKEFKRSIPRLIPDLNNIIQIESGNDYSFALNDVGQVFPFRIEPKTFSQRIIPIPLLNNIILISMGNNYSLFVNNEGRVYISSHVENCVLIDNIRNITEVSCGGDCMLLLTDEGQVIKLMDSRRNPIFIDKKFSPLPSMDNLEWKNIIPKFQTVMLSNEDNKLLEDIIQISVGKSHALMLNEKGDIYGYRESGFGINTAIRMPDINIME